MAGDQACQNFLGDRRACFLLVKHEPDQSYTEDLTLSDTSISGIRVARELDRIAEMRGFPCMVVSDNGTELTSNAMLKWQEDRQVEWHYIAPGKPMQNGFVESFMYRRPRGRKCFDRDRHRRVRSCIRPVHAALT